MEFLVGLVILCAIGYVVLSGIGALLKGFNEGSRGDKSGASPPALDVPVQVTFTTSVGSGSSGGRDIERDRVDTGELLEVAGGFTLNPKSPFPLTLNGIKRQDALALKSDLDWLWVQWTTRQEVAFLIAQKNLRCQEIDAFVFRQKQEVDRAVEQMRSASTEWVGASEKDRRDLLVGFQEKAIEALVERPPLARNFRLLLDGPPNNPEADDELLSLFASDLEAYKVYMYALSTAQSVRVVPAEDNYRQHFERFAEIGLARRGMEIPMADILASMKLKELNELIKDEVEKPVGRKAKAIDIAIRIPNLRDRLSSLISFRELFQVLPPAELEIDEAKRNFAWATEVGDLFCETYATGVRTLQTIKERREFQYKGWRIRAGDCCSSCMALDGKTYKSRPSKLPPYHPGCTCDLEGMYNGDA